MSEQLIQTPSVFGENGNYLLERQLGCGGMGGVYMGRDKMLDRPVAVKVMLKEYGADAEFVEKFKKEAQAAAKLIHPNIAQIYTYGISDGMPYIAMELVAGGSLWSIMKNNMGKTDVARVLKICQQVAQALQCSSDQGFVHGDIKPENILLDANGNAKLVDFGLAGMQKDTDEIWGTPYYIAPEKVRQEGVDFRADMYNLGGTLYHALTGVAPFEGDDVNAVVRARFFGTPKKPSEIRPDLTPAVDALVMKMLEAEKEKRYPSFEALIEEFKQVLTTGLEAAPTAATAAAPAATKPATSGKKVVMRGGRRVTMMRKARPAASASLPEDGTADEAVPDMPDQPAESAQDDEAEEGGKLGLKVLGVVVGVIALVGLVIGLLVWFKVSAANAEKRELQAQIERGFSTARSAIDGTRRAAVKFANDMDGFAGEAVKRCESTAAELKKLLPDYAEQLTPGPTKELLDAIASTNAAAPVAAAPAPASTNAAPAQAQASAANEASAAAPAEELPAAVSGMIALWERAYSCQASAVRIRHAMRKVIAVADEADGVKEPTQDSVGKLAKLSRDVAAIYADASASKDVENLRKGAGFIDSRGKTLLEQTVKRLRIEKLERERAEKKKAAEEAEKKRQEELAAAKNQLVEKELGEATAKFESIVAQGMLRQLDWKGAQHQLRALKAEFKTAEGALAVDIELHKVAAMQKMHSVLVKSLPGYTFKRSALKGCKVTGAKEGEIEFLRKDGKSKARMTFVKFYQGYRDNLREVVLRFVRDGRTNAKPPLNLRDWAEAMCGAALTATIICSDDGRAAADSQVIVKAVLEGFPDYAKTVKDMLPDLAGDGEAKEEQEKTEE